MSDQTFNTPTHVCVFKLIILDILKHSTYETLDSSKKNFNPFHLELSIL